MDPWLAILKYQPQSNDTEVGHPRPKTTTRYGGQEPTPEMWSIVGDSIRARQSPPNADGTKIPVASNWNIPLL